MKTSRILLLTAFVAGLIIFVWQAKTIHDLRSEVAELRTDLRTSLQSALENPAGLSPDMEQARREKLELIKLRHQVRELNETVVASHARERMANVRTVVQAILPATASSGPWKFRPEWQGFQTLATNQYSQAMRALAGATNEYMRFLYLDRAAKMSLAVGRTEDARQFATDLLLLDDKFSRGDPEKASGDAVSTGHLVLGRLALEAGQVEEAKRHLLAAGKSKGSPVLDNSGPNMSLAKDLLSRGEPETVLQYFELCRKFWTSNGGKLDQWTKDIQAGRIPDFGANLIY